MTTRARLQYPLQFALLLALGALMGCGYAWAF
jgi:hypothetical protein